MFDAAIIRRAKSARRALLQLAWYRCILRTKNEASFACVF